MNGKFIVIEGTDGSGKGTHTKLLTSWLSGLGQDVVEFDFPQYGQPSAYFVEQYLNGKYGDLSQIGPEKGSLFYALDRYEASFKIKAALEQGSIVVSNRYVGSNMGHQGGKIPGARDRKNYFVWEEHLEFEILGIPRPDLNIVLVMPSVQAQQFVDQKDERKYIGGEKRDLHEASLEHLQNAERTYKEICELFPETFTRIDCADGQKVLSIDDIQNKIRRLIEDEIAR